MYKVHILIMQHSCGCDVPKIVQHKSETETVRVIVPEPCPDCQKQEKGTEADIYKELVRISDFCTNQAVCHGCPLKVSGVGKCIFLSIPALWTNISKREWLRSLRGMAKEIRR